MRFIDVSGIGNSGKSAAVDFLREVDHIYVPGFQFEFDLIRTKDGLLDLRKSLIEDWSPIRSDIAYKLFLDKSKRMGINPKFYNIFGLLNSLSTRYNNHFNNKFFFHTDIFSKSLVKSSYYALWPFQEHLDNKFILLLKKALSRIGFKSLRMKKVFLLDPENFDKKVQEYLNNLFLELVSDNTESVVINNGIEPFNPLNGLKMLGKGSKQIVVLRDPRDIYVSGKSASMNSNPELAAPDNDGTNKSFLGTDNVDRFIERQKLFLNNLFVGDSDNVLVIWFEDLVLNYDDTTNKILSFLDIDLCNHIDKKKFFDPSKSINSIFIWKKYNNQDEITKITNHLNNYLYIRNSNT